MKYIPKQFKNSGYAILFTVVIISVISLISMGLVNAAYNQIILSSVAKDSQTAFYESDTASECALYVDTHTDIPNSTGITSYSCAGHKFNVTDLPAPATSRANGYQLNEASPSPSNPCIKIMVTKDATVTGTISTTLSAKGYNLCNLSAPRTVEREIKITY